MTSFVPKPPRWRIALALAAVYLSWGTTFLAIKEGVKTIPPCLFGGGRICSAGIVLFGYVILSGRPIRLSCREFAANWLVSWLLFAGGNGLMTAGQRMIPSGEASLLIATVPLWLALLEAMWPWGDRLTWVGWFGLLIGLAGVVALCADGLSQSAGIVGDRGTLFVLGSAFCWSAGSFVLRHRKFDGDRFTVATWQMIFGGSNLIAVGLARGELRSVTPQLLTSNAITAFCYLLVVGSLIGFLSYSWLLRHTSAMVAGTYAYVNPAVAIAVGWLCAGEQITGRVLTGMLIIVAGVALVRSGELGAVALSVVAEESGDSPALAATPTPMSEKI